MPAAGTIRFGRYSLHPTQGLRRGSREVRVTPKSLSVLRALTERSEQIVTKEELLCAVWPDTAVSNAALTSCIQELRQALEDDAREPRFIETVHRRGFRFLVPSSIDGSTDGALRVECTLGQPTAPIVGRDPALAQLCQRADRARHGARQIVFVTGEPGIGKTALVESFLSSIRDQTARGGLGNEDHDWRIARADCVERYGAGEAYQPLLEALTRLCRRPDGEQYITVLRRCAPTWLAQLPALHTPAEYAAMQRRSVGVTRVRMLRELTDALEAMSALGPMVLCLEDLHWSDASTLDWIASFARRPDGAAVLLIGTYRPGEATSVAGAPESMVEGLRLKGRCSDIPLARLDEPSVIEYVRARFPAAPDAGTSFERLGRLIHAQTEGNPFFIVNVLADLITRRIVAPDRDLWTVRETVDARTLGIPADVRKAIERQIERLDERECRLLEVASVLSGECSAATIGAGAGEPTSEVEAMLDALARRSAFVRRGPTLEWPNGTVSATFEFLHALYRTVLGERISPARRIELHRVIGLRLEAAYRDRSPEVAAELAVHFDEARDWPRAVAYHQHAADTDRRRSAFDGAQQHFRRALALLERLPASDEHAEREIGLQIGLGNVLMQISGWGAPAVAEAYERARELCQRRGATPQVFPALWNLWIYYSARGRLDALPALTDRLFELAHESADPAQLLQAHHARWSTLALLGDLRGSVEHVTEGLRLSKLERCDPHTLAYGSHDTAVCARAHGARALALSGRPSAALRMIDEAVARARDLDHPFTLAFALAHAAVIHQFRCEPQVSRTHAAAAHRIATDHSFPLLLTWSTCVLGWSMAALGEAGAGISMIEDGLRVANATGSEVYRSHWLALLADAQLRNGLVAEARGSIEEAVETCGRHGERFYLAELHRLRGELRLAAGADTGSRRLADADFGRALEIAEDQCARQLFLRAATSRARLWHDLGKHADAGALLERAREGLVERAPDARDPGAPLL